MLTFDEFMEYVEANLTRYMPEDLKDVTVERNSVTKNNGLVLHGVIIKKEGENVAPNIYLKQYYGEYSNGRHSLGEVMERIVNDYQNLGGQGYGFEKAVEEFKDFNKAKEKLFMVAVNREKNGDLLSTAPHTNKEDLALIYKVLMAKDEESIGTITILNDHLEYWGVTPDEIHEAAMKNTQEMFPASVHPMNDVIERIAKEEGLPLPDMEDMPADMMMYVITNEKGMHGAAAMFYEGVLSDLSEKLGSDLYILPSSIHETIALSVSAGDVEGLAAMVSEINETQLAVDDQLSDHVYRFDAKTKTLALADTSIEELGLTGEENNKTYAGMDMGEGRRNRRSR